MCLNLRTDAELTIDPLMPASLLKHLIILDGHTSQISHQLDVTPVNIGPDQIAARIEDIKTASGAPTRNK